MKKYSKVLLTVLIPLVNILFLPLVIFTSGRPGFSFFSLVVAGVALSILGLVFWLGGMASLGKSFAVLPRRQIKINRGLYKFFNHPIYLGIFLTFLGLSLCLGSAWGIFYDFFVVGPISVFRARREEKLLSTTS